MNRPWVLFHLNEARGAITQTIAAIEATPDYEWGQFSVEMAHLYHHLNTAWNAQNATDAEVERGGDDSFARWSSFPADLPMMGE